MSFVLNRYFPFIEVRTCVVGDKEPTSLHNTRRDGVCEETANAAITKHLGRLPMNRLHRLDRGILSHCLNDQALLNELLADIPRGTLYRHVEKLLGAGLLTKDGPVYTTTEQGKCRLAELSGQLDWNIWDEIYSPIRHVPTRHHRAMFELINAAIVARQARIRDDHHAGFVFMGPPLAWKTSEVTFQSRALGLDPSTTIIDLTTETGRSLLFRRDGRGNVLFKRDILEGLLICIDDLLEVQPSLRPALHHFLSGRIVIPVENTTVSIMPVPIITLNPKDKATLEEQTSFSTAQLRRLVGLNLKQVRLPDSGNDRPSRHRSGREA